MADGDCFEEAAVAAPVQRRSSLAYDRPRGEPIPIDGTTTKYRLRCTSGTRNPEKTAFREAELPKIEVVEARLTLTSTSFFKECGIITAR